MKIEARRMLITESAKLALTELREKAYLPKFGQRLRNGAFLWNRHDDESFHFGAYLEHELISTIRLTRVESQELFETLLQLSGAHPFASLPCWVLSRAATAPNYLGRSINMQLRAEAYRFLLSRRRPDAAEKFVYGTALANSQRLSFLRSLGYEIQDGQSRWEGYISADPSEVKIFRLPLDKIESAVTIIDPRR